MAERRCPDLGQCVVDLPVDEVLADVAAAERHEGHVRRHVVDVVDAPVRTEQVGGHDVGPAHSSPRPPEMLKVEPCCAITSGADSVMVPPSAVHSPMV